MNFAEYLSTGPTINAKPERWKGRFVTGPSPESIAKQVATKKRIRMDKWRNHFKQFPDMTATLDEMALHIKQAKQPTKCALIGLEEEYAVMRIGKAWKWILD